MHTKVLRGTDTSLRRMDLGLDGLGGLDGLRSLTVGRPWWSASSPSATRHTPWWCRSERLTGLQEWAERPTPSNATVPILTTLVELLEAPYARITHAECLAAAAILTNLCSMHPEAFGRREELPLRKLGPGQVLDRQAIFTAITAALASLLPSVDQGCRFLAPAPLLASMRPSGRAEPRVDRRPAKDRCQGGSASMLVHVSEGSMGQERAREPTMG